jgi:hypothetical protein
MLFIFEVSVRAYVTVAAKALRARHGDIAQNGCGEIDGHAGAEGSGDIDGLARSRANTAQIHPGFRRYVEDKSIVGARGTNAAKLAGRRGDLDSSMEGLYITRPDVQHKILVAGDVHDMVVVLQSKVASRNVMYGGSPI